MTSDRILKLIDWLLLNVQWAVIQRYLGREKVHQCYTVMWNRWYDNLGNDVRLPLAKYEELVVLTNKDAFCSCYHVAKVFLSLLGMGYSPSTFSNIIQVPFSYLIPHPSKMTEQKVRAYLHTTWDLSIQFCALHIGNRLQYHR